MVAKKMRAFWLVCPLVRGQRKSEEEQERVGLAFITNQLFGSEPIPLMTTKECLGRALKQKP